MGIARWATASARSVELFAGSANGLLNGAESPVVGYDNSTNRDLYAIVTVKLSSIAASSTASITLRVTISDGTDVSDRIGGDMYPVPLLAGTGAKVAVQRIVLPGPFSLRLSMVNNTGATLGNAEMYLRAWNEDVN